MKVLYKHDIQQTLTDLWQRGRARRGEVGVTNNLVTKSACKHSHLSLLVAAVRTGLTAIQLTVEVFISRLD